MDPVKRIAQHVAKAAIHHRGIADTVEKCSDMAKAAKADPRSLDMDQLSEVLESLLEHHSAIGDDGAECAEDVAKHFKEAEKSAAPDGLSKLARDPGMQAYIKRLVDEAVGNTAVPSLVSGVVPTKPGVTAVPRGGQPAIPEPPNVPSEFAKLVSVDDDAETPRMV
jgi:hypothetical protein